MITSRLRLRCGWMMLAGLSLGLAAGCGSESSADSKPTGSKPAGAVGEVSERRPGPMGGRTESPSYETVADAEPEPPRYEIRDEHDPNGIGKFYMGREIAHVMGFQAAGWLERPEREKEEQLTKLVESLGLKPGMAVADIGAGSGVISVMLARKVGPAGTVFAVDIQEEMLSLLQKKAEQLGLENIEPVLGDIKSPSLEAESVDLALMVDVYHEFSFPYEMLAGIARALKPGGRVAFVEYRREDPRVRRMIKLVHTMTQAQVKREATRPEFGLRWKETIGVLPVQHIIVFEKAGRDSPPGPERVGQWDRFEAVLENPRRYADPYRDVSLDVTYTRPDGRTVAFPGFYDGGRAWRFRFMPDVLGTWTYAAKFSDGAPGASGSFECVPSDIPGMISVYRENPVWFAYGGERPVVVRGLHVGDRFFAESFPDAHRLAFLEWAGGQKYNLLSIGSFLLNRDEPGRGRGWRTPRLWPLDAHEFTKLERLLDEVAASGMLVYPFAGLFGKNSDNPREPADQEAYLKYTLARLGPYWNLLFNVAGPEPNVGRGWMPPEEVERLGGAVRRLDVFGHPLSVHNRTGDDPYRDSDWTTFVTLQGPKTVDRKRLAAGLLRNQPGSKPLLAQETLWSGNQNHPDYGDEDLRKNAFVLGMCGAAVCFADNAGNSSSGFSGTMEFADCRVERHEIVGGVWDFFETVDFGRMRPRPDLVDNGWCLAASGEEYLVYLDAGGTVNVKLEGGPFAVEWINARDTDDRRDRGVTRDGRGLAAPDREDWVLRLSRNK
ncbi:MAG TPA: DUF5060 domain-containing protein [Planctomycetaceae bacterium]|nr:DUF5060 domain-containing protein [Planctomycetaceae bacterium]